MKYLEVCRWRSQRGCSPPFQQALPAFDWTGGQTPVQSPTSLQSHKAAPDSRLCNGNRGVLNVPRARHACHCVQICFALFSLLLCFCDVSNPENILLQIFNAQIDGRLVGYLPPPHLVHHGKTRLHAQKRRAVASCKAGLCISQLAGSCPTARY